MSVNGLRDTGRLSDGVYRPSYAYNSFLKLGGGGGQLWKNMESRTGCATLDYRPLPCSEQCDIFYLDNNCLICSVEKFGRFSVLVEMA